MTFLTDYALFLLKTITYVAATLGTVAGIVRIILKNRLSEKDKLTVKKLNEYYQKIADSLNQAILPKKQFKRYKKQHAAQAKQHSPEKRIFVLDFQGDMKASAVHGLREAVTAIIQTATPQDEVLLRLESPGGLVPHYGLAASQLARLKEYHIPLTVSIDKIAASGGYLMACVANQIIAAPFAIVGSIGVVTQFPNFNRLLKKHNIDFESVTAGNYKRTLTLFGENTDQDREKMQAQLEEVHTLFKDFIHEHRPTVDLTQVATGEHWLARQAIELKLVDQLTTSDDYLLQARTNANLYHVQYANPKLSFKERIGLYLSQIM